MSLASCTGIDPPNPFVTSSASLPVPVFCTMLQNLRSAHVTTEAFAVCAGLSKSLGLRYEKLIWELCSYIILENIQPGFVCWKQSGHWYLRNWWLNGWLHCEHFIMLEGFTLSALMLAVIAKRASTTMQIVLCAILMAAHWNVQKQMACEWLLRRECQ